MPLTLELSEVRKDIGLPARLLTLGLPLTLIVFGAGLALLLQPQEGLAFACLLGTILAPTDAAWGSRSSTTRVCRCGYAVRPMSKVG